MRIGLSIVAIMAMGLMGCGGGLEPTFGITPPVTPKGGAASESVPLKVNDIAAAYSIDYIRFDSDVSKDCKGFVELTPVLATVTAFTSCVQNDIKARLDNSYLIIGPAGNFSFHYNIVDDKGLPVKVGPFQSGDLTGTLKIKLLEMGFVAGESDGLADDQETAYTVKFDATTLMLTSIVEETPSPHFLKITATRIK